MITLINHSTDPYYNLAFEEYVFRTFREEDIFLVWQNGPCVVAGSGQNLCREVRPALLRRLGIPMLRRISGGGTVYHDLGNVNYSLMTAQEGPTDYGKALAPVVAALNRAGVPAARRGVCDLAIGEKKISGSAQRSAEGRLLHHGTLLFETDLDMLERVTSRGKNECVRSKGTPSAVSAVTNIRPHLARDMTLEDFKARLLAEMVPEESGRLALTEAQEAEVRRLRDEKYRSWQWMWGKTPGFTFAREGVFAGEPFRAGYQARRGIVSDAEVVSPVIDGRKAAELLSGARLDPEGFADICRTLAGDRAEELLELLL